MDPRSPYVHHHHHHNNNNHHHHYQQQQQQQPPTRYVSQPPPSHLPDFYTSHRPDHLPPPPPPPPQQLRPPPQQQSYHHTAPPPPLPPALNNPQNPQFSYNPNTFNHQIRDNYNRRLPEFDHYVRDNNNRPEFRVLAGDNWPYNHANLEHHPPEIYRRQLDQPPVSPIGKIRHEFEEIDYHHGRSGGQIRVFESNQGTYDIVRRDYEHDREVMRDLMSKEIDEVDGVRVFAGKREHFRGNVEFERHGSRGSNREGSHEFNRATPRKQLQQKKSAFLRIQKPNFRNRGEDHERVHHSGYYDDAKSSTFRGNSNKDQSSYADRGVREEVREGSPVELDVSFKSNSLVAKAIVTPSSSSTGVSDVKLEPRNSKVRKVLLVAGKDGSNLSVSKPNEGSEKLDNSVKVGNAVLRSEKVRKQPKETVVGSGIGSVHGTSSLPGSGNTNVLPEKGKVQVVSEKGGSNVVSGKISPFKVAKKKKIVKRVVKKVVNPDLGALSSRRQAKRDNLRKADCLYDGLSKTSVADKGTSVASVDISDSQACPDEVTVMPDNIKEEALAVSEKVDCASDSKRLCVPNIKRKRSVSTSPLPSSSHKGTESDVGLVNENSIKNLNVICNTKKDASICPNETSGSDIGTVEDVSKVSQDKDCFSLENSLVVGSPKILLSVEGNTDFGSLGSEKNEVKQSSVNEHNATMGVDNGLITLQEGITVSDSRSVDVGLNQPCTKTGSPSIVHRDVDEFLNACFSVKSNETFHPSNSGETRCQNVDICADPSNHEAEIMSASDNGCNNSDKFVFSSMDAGDGMVKQPSSDGIVASLDGISVRGSVDTVLSMGGNEDEKPNILMNDKKVEMPQLDLAGTDAAATYLENTNEIGHARWVDTTLRLSFKDSSPIEFNVSSEGVADGGLNLSTDSPRNKKRRISDSQLELSSPVLSHVNEKNVIADISTSVMEEPSVFNDGLAQLEEEVAVSGMDTLCTSDLPHLQKEVSPLINNCSVGGIITTAASVRDDSKDESLIGLCSSSVEDLVNAEAKSFCSSEMGVEQNANADLVMSGGSHQNDSMDMEIGEGEKMDVDMEEEDVIIDSGVASCQIPSELQSPDLHEKLPSADLENDSHPGVDANLLSITNLSSFVDVNRVSTSDTSDDHLITTSTCDEVLDFVPDTLPDMGAAETLHVPITTLSQISVKKVSGDDKILVDKPTVQDGSNLSACSSGSHDTKIVSNSVTALQGDHSFTWNKGVLPSQDSKNIVHLPNATNGELHGRKNHPGQTVSRTCPGRSSFVFTASKNTASSTHITKPRTWHRTDSSCASALPGNKAFVSTVPAHRQLPKNITKFQNTSYIRKGNSLVRNPTVVDPQYNVSHGLSSVYRLNSSTKDEVKKNAGSDDRLDGTDLPNIVRTGGKNTLCKRPRTPPLPSFPTIPNYTTNVLDVRMSSPLAEPLHGHSTETASDLNITENKVLKSSEDPLKFAEAPISQNGQISNLELQSEQNDGSVGSSNVKSVTYIKRRSNQLVATSNSCVLSLHNVHNTTSLLSDAYYKRRKNQLIRTPLESQVKQTDNVANETLDSREPTTQNMVPSRSFIKRRLSKVATKIRKPSKFSLVWTLHGAPLSKNDCNSLRSRKVLPHLFPWKRATYLRNSMANASSLSTIRNLLLLRKRDTVYTRSKHGFSLRKSKVLSVDGSSLKWSKSIERHSKKANEEATMAVAAAERKKRERNGAAHPVSGAKNRNNSSRERIFRIGSVRYRMDSSGRTLHRISDVESSCSADAQTEKDTMKSYVPRRLVIGRDEYVRIGNGNQLVRDPKKRTRILASEKVRWSLHTVRSRLAKKRKYCQFFTRFGKCNKDDGKCPYIHDSSKIAVCTKFLNGLCSNSDCKLTHKIIPERMPDCSYFLQGLCTNRNCPYRHVHVNPNASTCEGFLRGYCVDGNECRKKHSYVCPIYKATGSCPQGSNCKLHHPRNQSKGRKRKQSQEKKNGQGRYFGSLNIKISETGTAMSERVSALDDGFYFESSIGDYINLDISDEDAGDDNDPIDDQRTFSDVDPLDAKLGDLDELIKPIGIMCI